LEPDELTRAIAARDQLRPRHDPDTQSHYRACRPDSSKRPIRPRRAVKPTDHRGRQSRRRQSTDTQSNAHDFAPGHGSSRSNQGATRRENGEPTIPPYTHTPIKETTRERRRSVDGTRATPSITRAPAAGTAAWRSDPLGTSAEALETMRVPGVFQDSPAETPTRFFKRLGRAGFRRWEGRGSPREIGDYTAVVVISSIMLRGFLCAAGCQSIEFVLRV
jgi:hypothetical protein